MPPRCWPPSRRSRPSSTSSRPSTRLRDAAEAASPVDCAATAQLACGRLGVPARAPREAGEIPARTRRCDRGRTPHAVTVSVADGKTRQVGRSGSQKTCPQGVSIVPCVVHRAGRHALWIRTRESRAEPSVGPGFLLSSPKGGAWRQPRQVWRRPAAARRRRPSPSSPAGTERQVWRRPPDLGAARRRGLRHHHRRHRGHRASHPRGCLHLPASLGRAQRGGGRARPFRPQCPGHRSTKPAPGSPSAPSSRSPLPPPPCTRVSSTVCSRRSSWSRRRSR